MTQLFGGMNNWDRVPEFRFPGTKRVMKDSSPFARASYQDAFPERFFSRSRNSGTRAQIFKPPNNWVMSPKFLLVAMKRVILISAPFDTPAIRTRERRYNPHHGNERTGGPMCRPAH